MRARMLCLFLVAGLAIWAWQLRGADSGAAKGQPDTSEEAKTMAEAAKHAYQANAAAWEAQMVTISEVFAWSRRWKESQARIAQTKEERQIACVEHRDRMQNMYNRISALHNALAIGGEDTKYAAAKYYLAEAELWVKEAGEPATK